MHGSSTSVYVMGTCKACGEITQVHITTKLCVLSGCLEARKGTVIDA